MSKRGKADKEKMTTAKKRQMREKNDKKDERKWRKRGIGRGTETWVMAR